MSTADRIPVEGVTIDPVPDSCGRFVVYWPSGGHIVNSTPQGLENVGIPVPKPPRTGPGGTSEEMLRAFVLDFSLIDEERLDDARCAVRIALPLARAQVAEWDAEDEARS